MATTLKERYLSKWEERRRALTALGVSYEAMRAIAAHDWACARRGAPLLDDDTVRVWLASGISAVCLPITPEQMAAALTGESIAASFLARDGRWCPN